VTELALVISDQDSDFAPRWLLDLPIQAMTPPQEYVAFCPK
jgi:hypothetical protein